MVQKYYNVKQTAEKFGCSPEDVKAMLDRRELHGYRDGADWKFKTEDIDKMAKSRSAKKEEQQEESVDLHLGEIERDLLGDGPSSTIIEEEELKKGGDDKAKAGGKKGPKFDELNLTLDDDLILDDGPAGTKDRNAGSSGIAIGGDSGISLVDRADSGLSLEDPLLAGAGEDSLELDEDDSAVPAAKAKAKAAPQSDDDFLLTPLEEVGDDEDSESGSQIIALDTEGEEGAIVGDAPVAASAMLDEDLSDDQMLGLSDEGLGEPELAAEGAAQGVVLPEIPYTKGNIVLLSAAAFLLLLCGLFAFDLARNMWSWDGPMALNSSIMDAILGLLGQ
jgi:hypothetical protein